MATSRYTCEVGRVAADGAAQADGGVRQTVMPGEWQAFDHLGRVHRSVAIP